MIYMTIDDIFCKGTTVETIILTETENLENFTRSDLPLIKVGTYTLPTLLRGLLRSGALRRSGVFIVNFEHISHLALVLLLLILSRYMPAGLLLLPKVLSRVRLSLTNWE